MRSPKVTIVTITFNLIKAGREEMFRQCIESVHAQDYKNIEHIVIDGASKDGSVKLIKEYADKGWISFYSEPDTGIYNAMNKGLKKATGKYIAFLNSDDFFHDKKGVSKTVEALEASKADFSYAACRYLTAEGLYFGNLFPVIGSFFVRMPFSHQTMFTKTSFMRKLNGFDETFRSAGDYDFVIRSCLSGGKCVEVPCNFVSYRLGGLSDAQQDQSEKECIRSFEKNYEPLMRGVDYRKLFYDFLMPQELFEKIQPQVCEFLKSEMQQSLETSMAGDNHCRIICSYPVVSKLEQRFYKSQEKEWRLFGKFPVWRVRTKNSGAKRNYACCSVPFLQIKRAESKFLIFLFGLRAFKKVIKGPVTYYRILYLPILKTKRK